MSALAALYFEYFKIGLFAVGGGLATLPFVYQLAGRFPLAALSAAAIPNMLAVAQLLPGAVGVNLAAYTGTHAALVGGFVAVLGMITPQITVISIISRVYDAFQKNRVVKRVFDGLKPAAAGLLAAAGWSVWKLSLVNSAAADWRGKVKILNAIIFILCFILIRKTKAHPAIVIALAGVLGIALGGRI